MIGEFANHHLESISSPLWVGERVAIDDAEAFLKWFDDREIVEARVDLEIGLRRTRTWEENKKKWQEAMPPTFQSYQPMVMRYDSTAERVAFLRKELARDVPDRNERILALFAWFGSGAGPWSRYPMYERTAQRMLLEYPTAELLAAVEGKELTDAQTEGVARLFGCYTFSRLRPNDLQMLPAELKARLLEHSLASPDEDKRARARRAFGGG